MKTSGSKFGLEIMAALVVIGGIAGAGWWWHSPAEVKRQPTPVEQQQCALPVQPANTPHPGMIWVPGGSFVLGDTQYQEELPLRPTTVAGFWMDRTEVTNDEFAAFVKATAYVTVAERAIDPAEHPGLPPDMQKPGAVVFIIPKNIDASGEIAQWWRYIPGANWRHPGGPATTIAGRGAFPVVTVAYEDALAYAKWKGRSLPDEAQWEWASRAGRTTPAPEHEQPHDANTWQGLFPMVNSGSDGFVGIAPVGCYPPNPLGLFDMIGNVWELTADAWTPNHYPSLPPPDQLPTRMLGGKAGQHVIKGGSFLCAPNYCMRYRSGARQPQDDDLGSSHLGFRTILRAAGP